jgi:chromate transporter
MAEPGATPAAGTATPDPVPADAPPPAGDDTAALRQPASCAELFRVFNRLALQGFGGVLPIAHRELVERERWLSPLQFMDLLTVGQVLPGPNIVNISMILGHRWFGLRGALAASAGLLAVPLLIVLALALLYQQGAHLPMVAGALRGMGAVAAGLVVATALKLARTLTRNPLGRPWALLLAGATLVAVAWLRWPLVAVVLGLGGIGMALAAWRLPRLGPAP